MTKKILFILAVISFIVVGIKLKHGISEPIFVGVGVTFKAEEPKEQIPEPNITIPTKYDMALLNQAEQITLAGITITSYNNKVNQTDSTPNIMASNRVVYEGSVAVSRDIKKKYKLYYGDILYIPVLDKYFVIEDLMNKRFSNRIDIFTYDEKQSRSLFYTEQEIKVFRFDRD